MSNKRAHSDGRVLQRGRPGKVGAPKSARVSLGPFRHKLPSSTPRDAQPKLLARLKAAEEAVGAIRSGEVDAFMVSGPRGPKAVTLAGWEPAYRILVETMSEGAATVSRDGTVLYCNGRLAQLIHRPPRKVIGSAVQSLIVPAERDRLEALLAKAQKGVAKGEFNLRNRDGSLVPVQLSLNRLQGYGGHALGMVVTDLREQKRRHVEATRLQMAAIVESSQDAIIAKTLDAKIVTWNQGAENIFGHTAEEAIGRPDSILLPPGKDDELIAIRKQIRCGRKVEPFETKRQRKDATVIDVFLAVSPIKTPDGEIVGASAVARDITESKQAAEIKQAQTTRRLLLERMLSAQEEERRRVARELPDEAGQLLTSLLVGLRTLEHSRSLADVKAEGQRLRETIARAMGEIGRSLAGFTQPCWTTMAWVSRCGGASPNIRRSTRSLWISGSVNRILKTCPPVQIGLYRILQEALTNIARHSGARKARVKFARSATVLKVVVSDDGCGFDAAGVAVSSHRLGIQSMRERAALLGGTISFTSDHGKGTRMLLQIPLHNQDLQSSQGRVSA